MGGSILMVTRKTLLFLLMTKVFRQIILCPSNTYKVGLSVYLKILSLFTYTYIGILHAYIYNISTYI